MARKPKGRPVTGIVLLDKPGGMTSNRALQRVKRLYDARKAGHTGSLDPLATGLLPVCLGHATKISAFLLDADKRYEVVATFGARTDTADADGQVVETCSPNLTRGAVEAALPALRGPIAQVPPMYSALKQGGRRLYELARQGQEVARAARNVTIHSFDCQDIAGDTASFTVHCSKGTYVRTLVEDLASTMGTLAHVSSLRRTGVGPFSQEGQRTLNDLESVAEAGDLTALDALLLPPDRALAGWPEVKLGKDAAHFFVTGQSVTCSDGPAEGRVLAYSSDGEFLGIGEAQPGGSVAPKRLFR